MITTLRWRERQKEEKEKEEYEEMNTSETKFHARTLF